ncbi:start-2 domain protein, partial [Cystoisospora suis]
KYLDLAYRVEKDTSVSIKVRGKLPCRLFEVLSILNETDLAGTWAPFFKSAEREYQYTKASQLVRQVYDYPLLGSKETIMFCAGINALEEAGCVMIFCRSPPENVETFLGLPIPEKRKIQRIQSADLVFLLYPISEGKQTTLELYGNFHHGMRFVPMKIITFVVKKVVRGMFVSIARQCQQFETGPYKERVEKDKDFYTWMEEKIEEYVKQQKYAAFKIPAESISLASFNYEDFQD